MKKFLVITIIGIFLFVTLISLGAAESGYQGYQTIKTNHLEIIFEPAFKDEALQVASFGDEVYETLKEQLEYKGEKKVPVIITGRTAWANGYFSPFPYRIVLFVTSDDSLFLGHRSSSWLYSLFTHELTHFFHLSNPVGPASFLTPIFGPGVPNMNTIFMPGWWIEGITTNIETMFASGGRGDNERFKMKIKASLLDDASMWSLSKGAYSSILPPSGRIYLTGFFMLDYIIQKYGISSFNEINRHYARFPFFGPSAAIEETTGLTAQEVYQQALISFKESIDENLGKEAERLSKETIASYDMIDLIDGSLYATSYTLGKGISLLRIDSDGSQKEILSRISTTKEHGISVTKDGKKAYIIFQSGNSFHPSALLLAPTSFSDIYSLDVEKNRYEQITDKEKYYQLQLDENNNRIIALEAIKDRYRLIQLDIENLDKKVLFDEEKTSFYFPQYSKESKAITGVVVKGGTSSIVLFEDNEWRTIVGPTQAELRSPRFIDDTHISFVSDKDSPYSLYSVDIHTKETFLRYQDPIGILDAIISPKNTYYTSYRSTGESLFVVDSSFLEMRRTEFPINEPVLESWEKKEIPSFDEKRYIDYPKFNLWLPLPYIENNNVVPAAWTMWKSLLQKHSVQGQAGFSIKDQVMRASLQYQYSPGPISIDVNASYNEPDISPARKSRLSTSLSFPLYTLASPKGSHITQTTLLGGYAYSPISNHRVALLGQIGHSFYSNKAPLDSFGRFSYSLSYSLQDSILLSNGSHGFLSIARFSISLPIPLYHQNLQLEVRNAFSHAQLFSNLYNEQSILPPLYLTGFGDDGFNKTKLSLYYKIPIAPLDIAFGYGGIKEIDISLHASTNAYIDNNGFFFDDAYFFGATVAVQYVLGVGANFSPFIGFEMEATSGRYAFQIGISSSMIFIGGERLQPVL